MTATERRSRPLQLRDGDGQKLRGYAATFNDRYDLGPFEERIAPGAFDRVLGNDVVALFNHNDSQVLGRTTSGTLRLNVDRRGLLYEIDPPNSAQGLLELIERGDVSHSSFAFTVKRDEWEKIDDETGKELRTIHEVERLYDVSVVTQPANDNTDVALRCRDEARAQREADERAEPEPEQAEEPEEAEEAVEPLSIEWARLRVAEADSD